MSSGSFVPPEAVVPVNLKGVCPLQIVVSVSPSVRRETTLPETGLWTSILTARLISVQAEERTIRLYPVVSVSAGGLKLTAETFT